MRPRATARCSKRPALADLLRVPQGTVLVFEGDDLPVTQAGRFTGVVQQRQRQQREYFGLVWHQVGERPAEVDCLRGEVDSAAAPALVENQVDHAEDGYQPLG